MASKSKTLATGVTRHAPSDGTFSSQVDVDLKGDRTVGGNATLVQVRPGIRDASEPPQ